MSAYICDFYHISVLAVAIHQRVGIPSSLKPGDIAQQLYEENHRSVSFRYHQEPPEPFIFDASALAAGRAHSAVELIKAVHCYRYQACEHPHWEQSFAQWWTHRLIEQLVRELPGYAQAEWGLSKPQARRILQGA